MTRSHLRGCDPFPLDAIFRFGVSFAPRMGRRYATGKHGCSLVARLRAGDGETGPRRPADPARSPVAGNWLVRGDSGWDLPILRAMVGSDRGGLQFLVREVGVAVGLANRAVRPLARRAASSASGFVRTPSALG